MGNLEKAAFDLAQRNNNQIGDLSQIKADKNEVRLKGTKLNQTDMTDEFLQQMAGTTPINAIPADGAVTPKKTSFFDVVIGKNKLNPNDIDVKTDFQLQADASITNLSGWKVSGFIPVTNGSNLKASFDSSGVRTALNVRWMGYDANKNPVTSTYLASSTSFSNTANVSFVRISTLTDRFATAQIELGSVVTAYESYTETSNIKEGNMPSSYKSKATTTYVDVTVDSLIITPKKTAFFELSSDKNRYNPNDGDVKVDYQIQADGSITILSGWKVSGFITIKSGETLKASYNSSGVRTLLNGRWIGYDANKNPITSTYLSSSNSFTHSSNVAYVRFSILTDRFFELQIESGINMTAFEPFVEKNYLKKENLPALNTAFDVREAAERMYAMENRINFTWKPFDVGKVVFMLDDGRSDFSTANAVFKTYGFPLSLAFDTSNAGNLCDNGITVLNTALDMQANGGEVFSHSINGLDFSGVTNTEAEERLRESKKFLRENGFTVNGFISPNGFDMTSYIEISSKYYRYGYKLHNTKVQYNLARTNMTSNTIANNKALIDQCATNKSLLILMAHNINGTENGFTQANLEEILTYCKGKTGIQVTTIKNIFNQYGSI